MHELIFLGEVGSETLLGMYYSLHMHYRIRGINLQNFPEQTNSYDCGVFAVKVNKILLFTFPLVIALPLIRLHNILCLERNQTIVRYTYLYDCMLSLLWLEMT